MQELGGVPGMADLSGARISRSYSAMRSTARCTATPLPCKPRGRFPGPSQR